MLLIFLFGIFALAMFVDRLLHEETQQMLTDQQVAMVSLLAGEVNYELSDRLRGLEKVASCATPTMMGNAAAVQTFLESRPFFMSQFNAGAYITGIDGTAIASIPQGVARVGVNYMYRDHVAAALVEGRAKISQPAIGKVMKVPLFAMSAPIRNAQGAVIGALVGVVDLSKPNFLDQFFNSRYGQQGYYLLEDPKTRLIIAGSDKRRTMEQLPAPGINHLIDRHVQGFDDTGVTVNPLGVEVLASAKRVPVAGWFLVAALPTAEAFSPMTNVRERLLVAVVVLSLLVSGLVWRVLHLQFAPMRQASQALSTMTARGASHQALVIAQQDEVGQLINDFNGLLNKLMQREDEVRQLAFYDELTQLPNRRLLNDRLAQAMAASRRSGCYGAVMFLDLDNFKPLNDVHGHKVGDALLIEAASRLRMCIREMDTVARFGGDEFVVILNELNKSREESLVQAGLVAEKILVTLSHPYQLKVAIAGAADRLIEHHCTVSIGVVVFVNHDGHQEDLLRWADTAMYQAKEGGRNRIQFFQAAS